MTDDISRWNWIENTNVEPFFLPFFSFFSGIISFTFRTTRRVISGRRSFGDTRCFAEKKNSLFPTFLAISPGSFLPGVNGSFSYHEWENTGNTKRIWKRRFSKMFLFVVASTKTSKSERDIAERYLPRWRKFSADLRLSLRSSLKLTVHARIVNFRPTSCAFFTIPQITIYTIYSAKHLWIYLSKSNFNKIRYLKKIIFYTLCDDRFVIRLKKRKIKISK